VIDCIQEDAGALDLIDEQWQVIASLLGMTPRRLDGQGRPWRSNHEVFNAICRILSAALTADVADALPRRRKGARAGDSAPLVSSAGY
jgi:hypothetical protein